MSHRESSRGINIARGSLIFNLRKDKNVTEKNNFQYFSDKGTPVAILCQMW